MTPEAFSGGRALAVELRAILLELARREEERAANGAAAQSYWVACPAAVHGHRAAAEALRDQADQLLTVLPPAAA